MTDQEAAEIFLRELAPVIHKYETGGSGKLTPGQKHILKAAYNHFFRKPLNIGCCANDAIKQCINITRQYRNNGTK